MAKRITIVLSVLAALVVGVAIVGAQELPDAPDDPATTQEGRGPRGAFGDRGPRDGGHFGLIEIVTEASSLTVEDIQAAAGTGQSLVDLIGDETVVAGIIDTAVAQVLEAKPDADAAGVTERVTTALNEPIEARGERGSRGGGHFGLIEIVTEASGLTVEDIQAAAGTGQSLADLIGDETVVAGIIDTAVAQMLEAKPDADAAAVTERVTDFLNRPIEARGERGPRGGRGFRGAPSDVDNLPALPEAPDSSTLPALPEAPDA